MRKTLIVQIPRFENSGNRDLNKTYLITEWSAGRADRWMQEVVFASNRGAGALPMELAGVGWEGIAIIGINTFLRGMADGKELIALGDQLLECVKLIRDPKHPEIATDLVSDDDVEEVATRWWLRSEVVSVHVGFSPAAALSSLFNSIMSKQTAS